MQVLCKQIASLCKTRNSADEWYPTAYGLVTNTHSSIRSIKLLCGVFMSHIPVMQPAPLWNKILLHTANCMRTYPGMDGYSSHKDWDSLCSCVMKSKWGSEQFGVWKATSAYCRTVFRLQLNMITSLSTGRWHELILSRTCPSKRGGRDIFKHEKQQLPLRWSNLG